MNKVENLNFLEESLKSKIDNAKIISFDIFDTLLVRPYIKPTDLFYHLEKLYSANGYAQARIDAEKQARKNSQKAEITLEDIYNVIPKKFKIFQQKEMDFEYQVARINPIILPILDYVRQQGKKIIIISSMYLPKTLSEKMLHKIGVSDYSKIYVSCEVQKNKRDASIYKYVLEDLSCNPADILHIGDNENADIKPAKSLNINTHFVPKIIDAFFEKNVRAKLLPKICGDKLETSIFIALTAYFYFKNNINSKDLEETNYFKYIGYMLGGPLAYQYVSWIADSCKKKSINDIVFVARDGYSLSAVTSILFPELNSVYVYAPRKLSLGISLDYDKNNQDQVVTVSRFYKEYLKQEINPNDLNFPLMKEEQKFINTHYDEILQARETFKAEYLEYLEDIKFNKKKFALVDTATLWGTVSRLFTSLYPDANINSYYWRLNEPFNKGKLKIEFFDNKNESKALVRPYDIIEFLFTAPEPSVSIIKDKKPVYKKQTEAEAKRNNLYPYIYEGITNFAQDVLDIFGGEVITFSKNLVFNWVNIFLNNPDNNDLYFFQDVKHAGDINHSQYKLLFKDWYKNISLPLSKEHKANEVPEPFAQKNNIPIILASSNYFVPFLGVALNSLIKTSSPVNNYDIFILHTDIDKQHQKRLKVLEKNNVSIRFIDVNPYIAEYKHLMYTRERMSISTYFRFFIPTIFKNFNKCVWLDSDIIVNKDIAELYKINIENYYGAACTEFGVQRLLYTNVTREGAWRDYIRSQLNLSDATKYFSAGIMLWNIEELSKFDFTTECFNRLQNIPNPYCYDQDVLNSLFENKVLPLDANWNLPWNLEIKYPQIRQELSEELIKQYDAALEVPYIVHYCGMHKPWNYPNHYLADFWWKHAKESDFYEEILSYIFANKNDSSKERYYLKTLINFSHNYYKICLNYYRCKILKSISFGKRKEHYKNKRNLLKSQIRAIRDLK